MSKSGLDREWELSLIRQDCLCISATMGLNISKACENALVEMIGRLNDPKLETGLCGPPSLGEWGRGRDYSI